MGDGRFSDPEVLMFVILPILLVTGLLWAAAFAWVRDGHSRSAGLGGAALCGMAAALWMTMTWKIAATGVLRQWEANPPPLFVSWPRSSASPL